MKFNILIPICLVTLVLQWISSCTAHGSQTTIVKHTDTIDPESDGFWNKKVIWKARWVKYWRAKTIYVPIWKKVWGPVEQNEWVPIPNQPPGWQKRKSSSTSDSYYRTKLKEVDY